MPTLKPIAGYKDLDQLHDEDKTGPVFDEEDKTQPVVNQTSSTGPLPDAEDPTASTFQAADAATDTDVGEGIVVRQPQVETNEVAAGADASVDVEGDLDPTKGVDDRRFPVTDKQTVSGQMQGLLSKDSAYLEGGRAAGARAAAGRGLLNSTMGVQAGETARIAAALPIAQQDAGIYAQRAESKLGGQQSLEQISASGVEERKALSDRYGYEQGMSEQDHLQRLNELAAKGDIDAQLELQRYQQDRKLLSDRYGYESGMSKQAHVQSLTEMAAAGDIDAALELQRYKQDSKLQRQGHVESMAKLASQGDINSKLQLEQFGYDFDLSAAENIHRLEQLAAQGDINARLALQGFDIQTMLNEQTHGQTIELEDVRLQNAITLLGEQLANQLQLDDAGQARLIEQINLTHQNNLEQIGVTGGIAMQQQYLNNVALITTTGTAAIAQIYSTEGLTPAQQQNAVNYIRTRMEADIALLGSFFQQSDYFDWGDYADPEPEPEPPYTGPPIGPDDPPIVDGPIEDWP